MAGTGWLWRRDGHRQTTRALLRREENIGESVLGRPIEALCFEPPSYAKSRPPAILFGAIHGDEPLGVHCLAALVRDLVERPPGRQTWLVPAINPDGLAGGSKNNANDVDLNRNFAAKNWSADYKAGYFSGSTPESEPEVAALAALIERTGATRLVALHSPFKVVNWDGSGRKLAEEMAALNGYPASDDIGYATPGSFGSKYGVDLGLEVVTLEIPFCEPEQAWTVNRAALRHCVDLPA